MDKDLSNIKLEISKYILFWPYILEYVLVFLFSAFIYLRYVDYVFISEAKIEIIDKAQDSEMSLPTSMTIFNRSMINIENEIGVLTSFRINSRTVKSLKSNIRYYTSGNIKISENHFSDWFEDYNLKFKINTDTIRNKYKFTFSSENQGLVIKKIDSNDNIVKEYIFDKTFSTKTYANDLPFDFEVKITLILMKEF